MYRITREYVLRVFSLVSPFLDKKLQSWTTEEWGTRGSFVAAKSAELNKGSSGGNIILMDLQSCLSVCYRWWWNGGEDIGSFLRGFAQVLIAPSTVTEIAISSETAGQFRIAGFVLHWSIQITGHTLDWKCWGTEVNIRKHSKHFNSSELQVFKFFLKL